MIEGQALDMAGASLSVKDLDQLNGLKTGALIVASLRMGAIAAGASDQQLEALTKYGECFGLAFQITDDVLDVTSTAAEAGKWTGKDAAHGKKTYPMLTSVEESLRRCETLVSEAIAALKDLDSDHLIGLVQGLLGRRV
jgi:geranylgeranyl diphosphate synthase type II